MKRKLKIKDVTEGMPTACAYCGAAKEKDGSPVDLRPYGKNGAWICFDCGMKNSEETEKQFSGILNKNDIVITK